MTRRNSTEADPKLTRQGVRDLGAIRSPVPPPRRSPIAIIHDGRPRVAVDTCVSTKQIEELEAAGFYVAVVAEEGEPDAHWLARSAAAMVDLVVSPDREVGIWAYDTGKIFVRLNGNRSNNVLRLVRDAWRRWHASGCP